MTQNHLKGVILYVYGGAEFNEVVKFKVEGQGHKKKARSYEIDRIKLIKLFKIPPIWHKTTYQVSLCMFIGALSSMK